MNTITNGSTETVAELAGRRVREAAAQLQRAQLVTLAESDRMNEGQARSAIWGTPEGRELAGLIRSRAGLENAGEWLSGLQFQKSRSANSGAVEILRSGFPAA